MQTSDSIVIIPTYNERENIENIIRAVFALEHGFHILVIEDGSPDGTAAIVKALQQEFTDRLFLVERQGKLGLGTGKRSQGLVVQGEFGLLYRRREIIFQYIVSEFVLRGKFFAVVRLKQRQRVFHRSAYGGSIRAASAICDGRIFDPIGRRIF